MVGREEERHVGGGGARHAVNGARGGRPGGRLFVVVYGAVTGGVGGGRRLVGATQRPFSFPAVGMQFLLFIGQHLQWEQTLKFLYKEIRQWPVN